MEKIQEIRQKTVVTQIMDQMKDFIATGKFKSGDKLPTEKELSEMFGVGRSSIREAMKIFQYLGVVESKVPKGTYVCESQNISRELLTWAVLLNKNDFFDLKELRLVMEEQALWDLLVLRKDNLEERNKVISLLKKEIDNISEAQENGKVQEKIIADYHFHQIVINICHNTLFDSIYSTMEYFITEEMRRAEDEIKSFNLNAKERHEKLVKAIEEGDYEKASETFRYHIKDIEKVLNKSNSK